MLIIANLQVAICSFRMTDRISDDGATRTHEARDIISVEVTSQNALLRRRLLLLPLQPTMDF